MTEVTLGDVIVKTLWMAGLAVVVSMGIAVVIKLIVVVQDAFARKRLEQALKPAMAPALASTFDVAADHVAAIAAAVYSMVGAHRIVHIEEQRHGEWVVEGRLAHHASHAVSHHPKR